MLKTSLLVVYAAMTLGTLAAPSFAGDAIGGNCDGNICPINCGDGPCDVPPPNGNPPPPDLVPPTPEEEVSMAEQICNAALGKLRKVTLSEILAFSNEPGVKVIPVCERNGNLQQNADIDNSQAIHLQNAIGDNTALDDPLNDRGYGADDVVGVVITADGAILYVHKGA